MRSAATTPALDRALGVLRDNIARVNALPAKDPGAGYVVLRMTITEAEKLLEAAEKGDRG